MMDAKEIKTRLPLREVASMAGITLPRDGVKFCSPFRHDNTPSCSVSGDVLTDWTTGEHLDCIALYAAAKNISNADAIRELRPVAGGGRPRPVPPPATRHTSNAPRPLTATKELLQAAGESRGLSWEAFEAARVTFQTLRFASVFGHPCWLLSDAEEIGWEARRVDGKKFEALGTLSERKSHSKGQGLKSWPVGIRPAGFTPAKIHQQDPRILLVEGGPDYIAACQLILDLPHLVLPCAMLGKSSDIAPAALPHFRGRRVTIAGHPDARPRVEAWARQIAASGAAAIHPVLLGSGLDLNDHIRQHPHRLADLLTLLNLT